MKPFLFGPWAGPQWPFVTEYDFAGAAGWKCSRCGEAVERRRKCVPSTPWVLVMLGCTCGTVCHFQGDPAPANARAWRRAIELLKRTGAEVMMLNLNPADARSFGLN